MTRSSGHRAEVVRARHLVDVRRKPGKIREYEGLISTSPTVRKGLLGSGALGTVTST